MIWCVVQFFVFTYKGTPHLEIGLYFVVNPWSIPPYKMTKTPISRNDQPIKSTHLKPQSHIADSTDGCRLLNIVLFSNGSHPWKKINIYIFLWWVDGDNAYWRLSMVCCSKVPVVTQVWQGGLRKPDGWSGIVQRAWRRCLEA